jgi:hypothetical protein
MAIAGRFGHARFMAVRGLLLFFLVGTVAVGAEPEAAIRAALRDLSRTSYAWETTARQRSSGDAASLSLAPNSPLEVTGRTDPEGNTEVTLLPSRQTVDVPVRAVFKYGDAVGHTPLGWLRRTEIREAQGAERDRMVTFEGKPVRLSRSLEAALRAMALQTPAEEALDLIADVKAYREAEGVLIGELRDAAIEKLWAEPRAKSAPELMGHLIFKIVDGQVSEYHLLLGIGFPAAKSRGISWSVMQWTTRIRGLGTTMVDPPAAAVTKLND